jgi:NADH dehydrogenase
LWMTTYNSFDFSARWATVPAKMDGKKHILVLGAGFGGLTFCQRFSHPDARITLVDRQNHHLFQPLLYQVASAGLAAPDIAEPIRFILRKRQDITVLMEEVRAIHLSDRRVELSNHVLDFDYLVIALGGQTAYFGHPEWAEHAPGLKSLDDAVRIRRAMLMAFEQAENSQDPQERERLLTVAVIGGGPTGVEVAGAMAELSRHALSRDFRRINPQATRVVLVEGGPRLLSHLPPRLSERAREQLDRLGVDVRTGLRVRDLKRGQIDFEDGTSLEAANIVWAAGVEAHSITRTLGLQLDRAGRIPVEPDLSLADYRNIFAIGDIARINDPSGAPIPGVSPAAMQMAAHVARKVRLELKGGGPDASARRSFRYFDKGTMATIGRSAAVAKIGRWGFSGFTAWAAWLFVHLIFLIGFENRMVVLLQWAYSYFTYNRGARIIMGVDPQAQPEAKPAPQRTRP